MNFSSLQLYTSDIVCPTAELFNPYVKNLLVPVNVYLFAPVAVSYPFILLLFVTTYGTWSFEFGSHILTLLTLLLSPVNVLITLVPFDATFSVLSYNASATLTVFYSS